jgi:hypothetical protein
MKRSFVSPAYYAGIFWVSRSDVQYEPTTFVGSSYVAIPAPPPKESLDDALRRRPKGPYAS